MTIPALDHTHDINARSWVEGADGHPDFPIQNLPLCVFSTPDEGPRGGVAIGDFILDLAELCSRGHCAGAGLAVEMAARPPLNTFLGAGRQARVALRHALFELLTRADREDEIGPLLVPRAQATLHMPAFVGDYTDFYAGIHHAVKVGSLFRPDNPLLPNYKHVPIGYHGRASSVRESGTRVQRPSGQLAGPDGPRFAPAERLDYELELGIWVGPGNALGRSIPIARAADHIAGFCLLNDWSARDIQAWEYQPLGPFLAKNFLTSISPFIVTPEALAPFRSAQQRPEGDPEPLPYLSDAEDRATGGLALRLEVYLSTRKMRDAGLPPRRVSSGDSRDLYWTPAQMIAHHTSGGCNLQPGDLLGTGTISGNEPGTAGSLLELTDGGKSAILMPGGETRTFLQDGDQVIMRGFAERDGYARIGLGEVTGEVVG